MLPPTAARARAPRVLPLALLLCPVFGCAEGEGNSHRATTPPGGVVRYLPGVAGDWQVESGWARAELPATLPERLTRPCFAADFETDPVDVTPSGWTPVELADAQGFGPSNPESWTMVTVQPGGAGRVLALGPGPAAVGRLVPASPLTAYVLTAWVKPGDDSGGLLVTALRAEPPDQTLTSAQLAALFADPVQHAQKEPYLLTAATTAADSELRVEVIERRAGGFERWRFEFPTSFGTRSLLIAGVNGLDGRAAPRWLLDDVQVHEIPARAGLAWRPELYGWALPDPQMLDLEHRTALVRRDCDSRRALLLAPGSQVQAALTVPAGPGRIETALCLVEEDRLLRDGAVRQDARLVLECAGGLSGIDGLVLEQPLELLWEPGHSSAWTELQLPLLDSPEPRTVTLRVEVPGEDATDSPLVALAEVRFVPSRPADTGRPPNVVLVSLDTFRHDRLGRTVNGRSLTPHLDALCERSLVFDQALAPASYTLPSHVSMFTGQRPAIHGLLHPTNVYRPEGSRSFTEQLADAGYLTAAFTAGAMLNPSFCALHRGFDRYCEIDPLASESDPMPLNIPRWNAEDYNRALFDAQSMDAQVVPWLEAHADTPFFLFLHTYLVHNYHPGEPWREQHEVRPQIPAAALPAGAGPPAWEWTEPVSATRIAHTKLDPSDPAQFVKERDLPFLESLYDATVARADADVGRLLATLDRLGLTDDTLVIVVSDHGEEFCEHGGLSHARTLYEEMLRVPWILHVPGGTPRRIARAVNLSQLAATVLELTGIERDARITAPSALHEPESMQFTIHEGAFDPSIMLRAARGGGSKLIERGPAQVMHEEDRRVLSPQSDQILKELGYTVGDSELTSGVSWELYDLPADPAERQNLLDQGELPTELKTRLLRLRKELAHDP